jgi:hypothetical protein
VGHRVRSPSTIPRHGFHLSNQTPTTGTARLACQLESLTKALSALNAKGSTRRDRISAAGRVRIAGRSTGEMGQNQGAHDVSGGAQEDRGGAALKMGQMEARTKESRLAL